ncbi:hypothetical protein FB561_0451 [Kribbella amoyensis]|uniref:Uncharacterized protein n=1 Tax=Kribbella amoyensis TaxID=996641 RepID=A0A561BKN8_9ACTN|nr:hypothetical protein [Kribbella amoyensis]TWD79393.1 hypothetical protein FB561_0451 [Kribbella amoyensis]
MYVAYHLHWPHLAILDLEHATRATVIESIGRIRHQPGAPAPDQTWS